MPLFLNGEPFELEKFQKGAIAKYSREMVFRVGLQYITPVAQQDIASGESPREYWIGMVHIETRYFLYSKDNGVRKPVGELRYAEAVNPRPEMGHEVKEYTPAYIGIDDGTGSMTTGEYDFEKNFFLDNHPMNEVVKNNPDHHNHDPKKETVFATYSAERVADRQQAELDAAYEIETRLRERDNASVYVLNHDYLKAVASMLVNSAADKNLNMGDLMRWDTIEEKVLRQRLISITKRYPIVVKEAMDAHGIDYLVAIEALKEAGIIALTGDQWVHHINKTTREAFLKVPSGSDAQDWLYVFFKDRDPNGERYRKINETYKNFLKRQKQAKVPA